MTPARKAQFTREAAGGSTKPIKVPMLGGPDHFWNFDRESERWILRADFFYFVGRDMARDSSKWCAVQASKIDAQSWGVIAGELETRQAAIEAVYTHMRTHGYRIEGGE